MNIHEYQAKAILKQFDVAVPGGRLARSAAEAGKAARELGGSVWVVKAQIHAGGRGKGGGVKLCGTVQEVISVSEAMIGMNLVTHQTGPGGKEVEKVYIEEGCDIARELYLALLLDRKAGRLSFVSSTEGGVDIETVADATPDKILREIIDPASGMVQDYARNLACGLGLNGGHVLQAEKFIGGVYNAFIATDATLIEINPMVVTSDNQLLALDAKINFDDNALFRHPELAALRDVNEEDPLEREAQQHDLSYIKLEGNIGCMVNGAGLAMATMDIIKLFGGKPANFLDVGGGADEERVTKAFKIILSDPDVEAILVNIFGGIMRCDVIAEGIVAAARQISMHVPLVVRLEGTNVDLGKQILARSGVPLVTADDLADAAAKVVQTAGEAH